MAKPSPAPPVAPAAPEPVFCTAAPEPSGRVNVDGEHYDVFPLGSVMVEVYAADLEAQRLFEAAGISELDVDGLLYDDKKRATLKRGLELQIKAHVPELKKDLQAMPITTLLTLRSHVLRVAGRVDHGGPLKAPGVEPSSGQGGEAEST